MAAPKTDDFRIEREGDKLTATFTPTGRTYIFRLEEGGELSGPSVSPAQANAADYVENDIRQAAIELVRLAISGAPDA